RSRITIEQAKLELAANDTSQAIRRPLIRETPARMQAAPVRVMQPQRLQPLVRSAPAEAEMRRPVPVAPVMSGRVLNAEEKKRFGSMLENLIGTRGAYLLDNKMNVLGKVPFTELGSTLKTLNSGVYAIVFDGSADKEITDIAERAGVKHVVAMDSKVNGTAVNVVTAAEL
ncbi:MAG: hypothetical protein QXR48_02665, partial [Candidatus Woesearchaeota archaeon]